MQRDPKAFLFDAHRALQDIERFTAGKALEDYMEDELLIAAVERKFAVIGEALNRYVGLVPQAPTQIPDVRAIVNFRNKVVHGYFSLDHEVVWGVVEEDVPVLRVRVAQLLEED